MFKTKLIQYYEQIRHALETDDEARQFRLAATLERIEKGQYGGGQYSANSSHASEHSQMYASHHSYGQSPYGSQSNFHRHHRQPPPPPPPPVPKPRHYHYQ